MLGVQTFRLFSIAYELFLHSFAQERKATPFLSTVSALFAENGGEWHPESFSCTTGAHSITPPHPRVGPNPNPLFANSSKTLP
jgi:hypothetical protein